MKRFFWTCVAFSGLLNGLAIAQPVAVKQLSVDMTLTLISTAAKCAKTDLITVAIVDRNQSLIASFRGPTATQYTVDVARMKATTAAQTGRPTGPGNGQGRGGAAASDNPPSPEMTAINNLASTVRAAANGQTTFRGGLPIMIGDEIIGAIGLSGSAQIEEPCAKEAIAAIQSVLK